MNTTPSSRPCPQCGAPIPAGASEGLCPRCLLALNLATQSRMEGDTRPPDAGPAVPPLPVEEVAKLFPGLEIIRLVGTGGMGAVYQARQPALDRVVALKLLHTPPASDPGFAERFAQEARALAKLNHPNIVALYESGQAGGRPYFLMEFVDGVNLRQLQQAGRLSPREALQIVPQVCDALQYAHDEGIVHRDIKPENVLLDRKGRVKVADFGLAKLMGRETATTRLTGAGHVMGTPHYMAPEQVEHPLEVDHRADIFSLGVVFYELLTGELPLGKFPLPSKRVRLDVRLDEVVLKALEKEPALRYGQASELKTRVEMIAGTSGQADVEGETGASASSAGNVKKKRSIKGWAWRFMPAVAVLLVFFNPWGPRAWYWFAAACAVLSVLPSFRLSRWWWPVGLCGIVAVLATIVPWRDHVRPMQAPSSAGTVQNDVPPQLRALAWLDEIQARSDWAGWSPSGEPIRKADMHLPDGVTTPTGVDVSGTKAAGEEPRFLCLWISHPQFDAQSVVEITLLDDKGKPLEVPSKESGTGVSPPQDNSGNLGWITATLCAGRRGHVPDFAAVKLRYSAGAWRFWDNLSPDFTGFRALGNGVQLTPPGQGADGRAFVMLTHDLGKDTGVEQFDFVAILKDGRRLERTGHSDSGSDTVRNERFIFDAPLSQVKAFQIRKRPVRQMTWLVVLLAGSSGTAAAPPSDAARDWLALMDKGDYAQSWSAAADSFRDAVTKAKWAGESEKIRKPFGVVISRTLTLIQQTKTFPGMPAGCYWMAEYDTVFARQNSAAEVVTFALEKDGQWRMIGYLIRPRTEEERAVVLAARAWLEGIDAGRYAESWSNASGLFREALSQKKWVEALEEVRRPLGARVFRTADGCTTTTSLPGVPAGKYVVMQFNASFTEDKSAVETVTFMQEKDGVWRAAGYFIK